MQLKSLVRYPLDIRRARRLLAAQRAPQDAFWQRPIALDLVTPELLFDCGRHLASLAHYSQDAGSPFFVRCDQLLLAGIARKIHGRETLAEPYVRWLAVGQPLPDSALVLRDFDSHQPGVRMLIGRDQVDGAPTMPYPMHPATLPFADHPSLLRLRDSKDRCGIFFAGNQKPKYGDDKMTRNFGLLSRLRILQTLRRRFPDRIVDSLDGCVDHHSIVLSDSRVESIPAARWLPSLARAILHLLPRRESADMPQFDRSDERGDHSVDRVRFPRHTTAARRNPGNHVRGRAGIDCRDRANQSAFGG